ncbi:Protein N-acetyltransferase, RimJ/RimL family [Modestobacter sp. DSM 44400]|uniref:GNAT family N-acetyltransferase n=1 Tax=Modestobacter sp. DSM 44400 TaxID=1550230 RepID=UPI00089AE6DE|nr:GNAT family N-acetyltransferase [Modestobacter sp. DSM 44400]SDY99077.1 Protein N-acetyltransferase, RimJ/RimL family [Modestobacter sp. DSM 44400]
MHPLDTDRLQLRAWSDEDIGFVFDMYSRWEVQRFIGLVPRVMADRGEAEAVIARWRSLDDPVCGVWAVQRRADGHLLGTLLLKPIPASSDRTPLPPSGDIEIGWHFHPDVWGHGYATEAASRALKHAFDSGLPEVVAVTKEANTASQAVAGRIGMTHQGKTTRYYNATCELFVATRPAS